jgi:putative transposase
MAPLLDGSSAGELI